MKPVVQVAKEIMELLQVKSHAIALIPDENISQLCQAVVDAEKIMLGFPLVYGTAGEWLEKYATGKGGMKWAKEK